MTQQNNKKEKIEPIKILKVLSVILLIVYISQFILVSKPVVEHPYISALIIILLICSAVLFAKYFKLKKAEQPKKASTPKPPFYYAWKTALIFNTVLIIVIISMIISLIGCEGSSCAFGIMPAYLILILMPSLIILGALSIIVKINKK